MVYTFLLKLLLNPHSLSHCFMFLGFFLCLAVCSVCSVNWHDLLRLLYCSLKFLTLSWNLFFLSPSFCGLLYFWWWYWFFSNYLFPFPSFSAFLYVFILFAWNVFLFHSCLEYLFSYNCESKCNYLYSESLRKSRLKIIFVVIFSGICGPPICCGCIQEYSLLGRLEANRRVFSRQGSWSGDC